MIRADCRGGGYELCCPATLQEWESTVTGNAFKIKVRCLGCKYVTDVVIRNFHVRKGAKCFCTGAVEWKSRHGHLQFLKIVETTSFELLNGLAEFQNWKRAKITNHSKVSLRCRVCSAVNDRVEVNAFSRNRSALCACSRKTQRMVFDFIADLVANQPGVCCANEYVIGTWPSGRPMCTDIAIVANDNPCLCIEIDGAQHFRTNTGFKCDSAAIRQRDYDKEICCIKRGIPMLRLVQEDVWDKKFDWKKTITMFVKKSLQNKIRQGIHTQCSVLYSSGPYAAMREGWRVV